MTEQASNQQPRGTQERGRVSELTGTARQRAIDAYDRARQGVNQASQRTTDAIDEAPLIALAGGLAAGALLAALLPRTRTEEQLLGPVGERVSNAARQATQAAKEAGTSRLSELGLTPDKGKEVLRSILDGVTDAAKTSAQAAAQSVKSTQ